MAGAGFDSFQELWISDQRPATGVYEGLRYSHDGEYLFCCAHIPAVGTYRQAARAAYRSVFRLMDELGYRHTFRIWNFVAGINSPNAEGTEFYRDFCFGRAEAFAERSDRIDWMPAATAVGVRGEGIALAVLACRGGSVRSVESQRQVPAYRYPRQYGLRPPAFARATGLFPHGAAPGQGNLFISGTSSITGHQTRHAGRVAEQTRLSLENIRHLISQENLAGTGLGGFELADVDAVKVYVRQVEHLATVRDICAEAFPLGLEPALLHADLCRSDLLVEIEGIVSFEGRPPGGGVTRSAYLAGDR